jgi:RNA polymerase sigma-70 factor, ECF subfamily
LVTADSGVSQIGTSQPYEASPEEPFGTAEAVPAWQRGHQAQAGWLVDLVDRCARNHEAAFEALYDATAARIYGIVLRVLRAPDQAAEVTQEVFVEIWRQAATYQPEKGSVLAWMTTVAHRRAVDRVRCVTSEAAREDRYATLNAERSRDLVWDAVQGRLDVERIRDAMDSLTPIQKEAITLAYFGGYTQSQVAQLLSIPLGTAKTRIRDGLIGLRDALGGGS